MLGDSWVDELRVTAQLRSSIICGRNFKTPDLHPSNYYSLGAVYMWSETTDQRLRTSTSKILGGPSSQRAIGLDLGMAWGCCLVLGDEKLAIKYCKREQLRDMLSEEQTLAPTFCCSAASLLSPATFPVESAEQLLIKKANHWRVKNWPGPIAQYNPRNCV